jgi:hypothetical protein
MSWKNAVKKLNLNDEQEFLKFLEKTPCEPIMYLLEFQDKVGVDIQDYYKILEQKYLEENNRELLKVAREYQYLVRDDR